ncbi:hypothetical protein NEFER03_0018 [Nematocida sp. LUAm3]|nr:hypothetical protein NEFER03_0018 [Nematocida sp. LUAm3]KAI5173501.1 hypothetical protein NEFER02_0017 [Nematocida sp. LUAm2]KAI5176693.1 hypothetical protein NEFER01_0018 [Nematocida sp. LUAm1]
MNKEACGCSEVSSKCREKYLEAYKCYLKNEKAPEVCLREINAMRICYEQDKNIYNRLRRGVDWVKAYLLNK